MKVFLLCALLLIGPAKPIPANPLAIDGSQRPIEMIAEQVNISVGPKLSHVHGIYKFRQKNTPNGSETHTHVLIYVPVFLSSKAKTSEPPRVVVNGVQIQERQWNDITLSDDPSDLWYETVKHFPLKAYQYAVPLNLIQKTFSVSVSYQQINLPGSVAPYIPINPPQTCAQITFTAQSGYCLKPFDARRFWNPSYSSLSFPPKHRELLLVKCVKGEKCVAAQP